MKRSKERSDAVDELQRQTMTGFRHICELLGVPEHEDDIHVPEVVSCYSIQYNNKSIAIMNMVKLSGNDFATRITILLYATILQQE